MSDEDPVQRLTRARLRQLQKLKTARERREQGQFLIEGEKLVHDAIAAEASIIELLTTSPDRWSQADVPVTKLSRADAERLSDTRTPQGHFALVRNELGSPGAPSGAQWQVVVLDAVQDAGNVGGIIRSAAAFEIDLVLIGPGTADPTHPRVTRAATGAWFQVRIARSSNLADDVDTLRRGGATVLAADSSGGKLDSCSIPAKVAWIVGNEGSGVSADLDPLVDARVAVPIAEGVDSLNVNVAAGIILHHAYERVHERSAT
ncbi:MAG: RNA methyltransferase [Chloroflexota bacterium]|nr:RNA methyltransferase [Chloroflexota bacterium]